MPAKTETLGFLVADVSRLMRRSFQQRFAGGTLTFSQARALLHISRNEGIRQVDLAELLEIQPITLVRLVDQLADAGLIERRSDPTDGRAFQLYLTAAAAPQLNAISRVGARTRSQALHGLTKAEAAALTSALQKIRANLAATK